MANAQSTGLVPVTLGLWSMGNVASFILHAIFWELVLNWNPCGDWRNLGLAMVEENAR